MALGGEDRSAGASWMWLWGDRSRCEKDGMGFSRALLCVSRPPSSRTDLNIRRQPTPTPHSFIVCFASPTAHPIPHVESALLPLRPSSIHIGLAQADPAIAQSGCALPVESAFAQFREREGGGVDLGMRVEATATDEQEDGWDGMAGIGGPRRRLSPSPPLPLS
ncbi:hypothetical protein B0H14DRAFT_1408558 [Mycena olivaceomarginata]|nr:hypothetical protein B0H14DRAFT_1408558 [Mycena olivaceomarginata]